MSVLSVVADIASLLGFALTLWVAWNVKRLRTFYTLVRIAPVRIARIAELSETIRQLHEQFQNSREVIVVELGRLITTSESLAKLLPREQRKSIQEMVAMIRRYQGGSRTPEALWMIYGKSQNVLEDLKNFQEERQWQR